MGKKLKLVSKLNARHTALDAVSPEMRYEALLGLFGILVRKQWLNKGLNQHLQYNVIGRITPNPQSIHEQ